MNKLVQSISLLSFALLLVFESVGPEFCFAKDLEEPGAKSTQETDLVLNVLSLKESSDKSANKLSVHVKAKPRCMFGDWDAIRLDLNRTGGHSQLVLTLEPLADDGDKEPLKVSRIVEDGDKKDLTLAKYSVEVPAYEKPTVFGVFLCGASQEENKAGNITCRDKALMGYDKIFEPYKLVEKKTKDGKKMPAPAYYSQEKQSLVEGKIYFFRFLIATKDSVLFPKQAMAEEDYDSLVQVLRKQNANVPDFEALISLLKKYGDTLGSMPLEEGSKHIEVMLPYYDKKKCGGYNP